MYMRRFIKLDIIFYFTLLLLGVGGFFFAVVWPQMEGFYAFIVSASVGGLGVTGYIYYTKHYHKQLACPSAADCNAVVTSKYSVFLGVALEYWGMLYYGITFVLYLTLIFLPFMRETLLAPLLLLASAIAVLFSMYLIFVQAFLLRKWCIWCLLSSALSMAIFLAALISLDAMAPFLIGLKPMLIAMKDLGYVLGMGGSTAAIFLFLKFLNDFNIDDREASSLKSTAEIIWFGLGLIFVAQYAQYVAEPNILARSGIFLAEITALSVAFVSGAVLKVIFAPFLAVIPFYNKDKSPLELVRKATLVSGAVALVSWYFAFFVQYISGYSLSVYLLAYAVVLGAVVASCLVVERLITRRKQMT